MSPSRISDLRLERLAAGDLPPAEERALRARLEGDTEARDRLAAIEQTTPELLVAFPPDLVYEEVARRLGGPPEDAVRRPAPSFRLLAVLRAPPAWAALAACAALVMLVLRPWEAGPPGERTKGARPGLVVHRIAGEATEQLSDGDLVRAGDLIQLTLRRADGRHAVVVSVDGDGQVTLHYPLSDEEAGPVGGSLFSLPRSYELDRARGFECFLLVTDRAPLDTGPVLDGARRLARSKDQACGAPLSGLPPTAQQAWFLLKKAR